MNILSDIDTFSPINGDWRPLETLLAELWGTGVREGQLPILFKLFERYPDEDAAGVLWSIVHGIESLPYDYEIPLRESMSRHPSPMGKIMLDRLEKSRAA